MEMSDRAQITDNAPSLPRGSHSTAKGLILVLAQALPIMAVVSLFPVIPKLAAQFGSVPNAAFLVPMIITLPSFGVALLSPAAGWLADRFGRRPVFMASLIIYVLAGLAPLVLDQLKWVVGSRAVLGIAEAGIVTVASTLIADYFGGDRHRWLAIQSGLGSLLGTVLIAVGGWLAEYSWRGPFTVYATAVPLLAFAFFYIDEPERVTRSDVEAVRAAFPWRVALVVGFVSLVASVLYYVEPTQIATLFTERGLQSSARIGQIQALTSIAYIVGAYVFKRVSNRAIGVQLMIAGGFIGIGLIGIGLSHTVQQAALWAVPQQLGAGMVIPALTGWAQGSVSTGLRGRAMGIWATFFFAGLFLCPNVVTVTTNAVGGLSETFWILGVVTCVLAVVSMAAVARSRQFAAST